MHKGRTFVTFLYSPSLLALSIVAFLALPSSSTSSSYKNPLTFILFLSLYLFLLEFFHSLLLVFFSSSASFLQFSLSTFKFTSFSAFHSDFCFHMFFLLLVFWFCIHGFMPLLSSSSLPFDPSYTFSIPSHCFDVVLFSVSSIPHISSLYIFFQSFIVHFFFLLLCFFIPLCYVVFLFQQSYSSSSLIITIMNQTLDINALIM